uniref:Uncharacterized protein n=1 Tax=Aegilops tauschii subsp. strangulata TaxID=200361 RepID=A0A453A0N0_AEGTS
AAEGPAAARRPPPALVRERRVPAAVGARVPRRPLQALLLLPPLRIPAVNNQLHLLVPQDRNVNSARNSLVYSRFPGVVSIGHGYFISAHLVFRPCLEMFFLKSSRFLMHA